MLYGQKGEKQALHVVRRKKASCHILRDNSTNILKEEIGE